MIVKLILVKVVPGRRDEFIRQQRVWNDVMSRQPGFLGVQVATDPQSPEDITIMVAMESREALERFMKGSHDNVERQTSMKSLYSSLKVQVLDVVDSVGTTEQVRVDLAASRSGKGHPVAVLSELYRVSAILRVGVQAGLFEAVDAGGTALTALAARCGTAPEHLRRLVEGLASFDLLALEDETVRIRPAAVRYLRRGSPEYLGDLVLHNTRPALWKRWAELGEQLGLPVREEEGHERFILAMKGIARAGQVEALLRVLDLRGRRRLLDIGGAEASYTVALCQRYPELQGVVLDLAATEPLARADLEEAGLGERVRFIAGDYRQQLPSGDFDVILLSNILRGEKRGEAAALVRRAANSLSPGGLLIVQDLFVGEPRGTGPLLAALFGLHLPEAMNGSVSEVSALLQEAGLTSVRVQPLDGYVVADQVITAVRPA
jgi:heme-degrading monooxygenase HmoA/predicted O-methyltransferase YrrM